MLSEIRGWAKQSLVLVTCAMMVLLLGGQASANLPMDAWTPEPDKSAQVELVPNQPEGCSPGAWTPAAPVPSNVYRYGFAQNGDDFYIIAINVTYKYNVVTNSWVNLAPVPRNLQMQGVAYYNGKLYIAGGRDDGPSQDFFIYDIAANTWTVGPNMPIFSFGSAAGAYNGSVYVVTGTSGQYLAIYNIAANTWSIGPNLPVSYSIGGVTQVGQYLYLIGSLGSTGTNVSRRLDMASVTWSTGPMWTPARGDFALASDGVKLYAMGGRSFSESGPSAEVYELTMADWPGGQWTRRLPDLPSPRQANQAGFSTTGRIWSTGGYGAGPVYTNEHLYLDVAPCGTTTPTQTPTFAPTATNTPTATHTPTTTPAPMLVGHVNWQARPAQPDPLQALPITLTLKSGATEINYPTQFTDQYGFFTITLGGLPNGTYDWRADDAASALHSPNYLANSGTVVLERWNVGTLERWDKNVPTFQRSNVLTIFVEIGLMRTGDANNDNLVSLLDFNILRVAFGNGCGNSGYDSRADFTGDCIVNIMDFNPLKANFGLLGAPPLGPGQR